MTSHPNLLAQMFNALCLDLAGAQLSDIQYSMEMVDRLLAMATDLRASDVHLQPSEEGIELKLRIDGVLQACGFLPPAIAQRVMARLMVMADLVHYRHDIPQEGRILGQRRDRQIRISVLPTLHGEKIVLRFFAGPGQYRTIDELDFPPDVTATLRAALSETMGAIVVTGPAGSGKTSTLYACLRELTAGRDGVQRSIASLEDPIELAIPGVAQTEVNPMVGLDLAAGLRYLLRQDPEVIMMGEIRDRATADAVFQASLTGHLLLTTFHSGSAFEAISRLIEMDIEPYLVRSALKVVLSQRLVRRLCSCARPGTDPTDAMNLPVESFCLPVGCSHCGGTGYLGRMALVELLLVNSPDVGRAILQRCDTQRLERIAVESGMVTRWQRGLRAVEQGLTSPAELRRAFGLLNDDRILPADRASTPVAVC